MKWAKIYVFIQNFRHDALTALAEVMAASVIKQVDLPLASGPNLYAISALLSSEVAVLVPTNEQHPMAERLLAGTRPANTQCWSSCILQQ